MKSEKEYMDSIYKKQEAYICKQKQQRTRRKTMVVTAGILCVALVLGFVLKPLIFKGDSDYVVHAANLMKDINPGKTAEKDGKATDEVFVKAYADFALELFGRMADSSENVLVSPLSVYIALAMTANGASDDTLLQMEKLLGVDIESLNAYMLAYTKSLSSTDEGKINIANSIWLNNDGNLAVKDAFLQTNADYYASDVYSASFDNKTLKDINSWVNNKTDGMIESVLDAIDPRSVMYLINAMLFDADWKIQYTAEDVDKKSFVSADGKSESIEFLNSTEHIYLEDEDAVGIIKPYKNEQYSFVALLPNEELDVEAFAKTLTGEKWLKLIEGKESASVVTAIPRFEYDYSTELRDILKAMGINDAFNSNSADFSRLGSSTTGPIYIGDVLHNTHISVTELGTEAGAASTVIMLAGGAMQSKDIVFNRPFVYAIMDNNTKLPIFIGTMMEAYNGNDKAIVSDESDVKEIEEVIKEEPVEYCEGVLKYTVDKNGEAKITGVTDKTIENAVVPERIGATKDFEGYVVTNIGCCAFYFCENLKTVKLPDTITCIEGQAFCCCTGLKNINIPDSVNRICGFAFANCDSLTEVVIPEGVTEMEYRVFYDSNNIEKIVLPDTVTIIEEGAFERCYKLTEINIPKGLTYIGWAAFEKCGGITKLEMPENVIKIEPDAFKYCTNLEEVLLPETVEYIGPTAFWEDSKLTIITPAGSYAESYANKKSIDVRNQ